MKPESVIKIERIPFIKPEALEKLYNSKGELTGLVTFETISLKELKRRYPNEH